MKLYTTADCSGSPVATGPADDFASTGFTASVSDDSLTMFRATAADTAGNTSACSTDSFTYVEDSTAPAAPTLTDTDPASPANDNFLGVKGTAESGSTVRLYTSSDCSGAAAATGSEAGFATPGIPVAVADDSTTTFYATATRRRRQHVHLFGHVHHVRRGLHRAD